MEEKIYFMPGDVVTLKQDIPNKPTMIVVKKENSIFKYSEEKVLKGIRCIWFSTDQKIQESIFNTKDLVKL